MSIVEALQIGILLAEMAGKGAAAAQEGKALIDKLSAEGRDPTTEEMAALRKAAEAVHEQIQSA